MEFLAVVGWFALVALGLWLLVAGVASTYMIRLFGGRAEILPFVLLAFGAGVIALGWWLAPFTIEMRSVS